MFYIVTSIVYFFAVFPVLLWLYRIRLAYADAEKLPQTKALTALLLLLIFWPIILFAWTAIRLGGQ